MPAAKGKVEIEHHGKIADEQTPLPMDWPRGEIFMNMMTIPSESQADQEYWQSCARWALLQKYGLLEKYDPYVVQEDGSRKLVFSSEQMQQIQSKWQEARSEGGNATIPKELSDFFKTSFSNDRPLQWSLMDCGPASQFHLHAHPNIELVYCVRGELHEVRMDGDAYDVSSNGKGPSLVDCTRSWSFATLRQGCWLVNEVGSIHKSFTATSSKGCTLLVLWGGGHADVAEGEEPRAVDVPGAVNQMDSKLDCNCGTAATEIQETFLPESEKDSSSSD
mmetsp:Transcript_6101/g.10147  ORF Transcript_6101/g.10147 Transcript_6101/m.10147 type:complete len:277 (+) Transcript_6101:175-1005(+)|eukprot:CAMPEP_0119026790 /NCGR_PEP_ID=MMETSP1176-20130426/36060_1 /TAXON_ID=265551 /ORGANISM="Synedropsis recta cf, Strain CCMP1620" /LENGTH=276 /DNA_ID=CAMNT_0006982579 /DNA_START=86 /DNA_END=916 /DNA_ORIENTATION=-